jgi:hypothetical protein
MEQAQQAFIDEDFARAEEVRALRIVEGMGWEKRNLAKFCLHLTPK